MIVGGLPPQVRERFGIRGPASLKWYPAARAGWLREQGRAPARF
ncbi:hypothetical protein [Mycolicibacterium monacense]|nr:hypothetical protein [Mycolicibacterium monacense DSM 44395]